MYINVHENIYNFPMNFHGYPSEKMLHFNLMYFHEHSWMFMIFHERSWKKHRLKHELPWISINIHEYPWIWISMNINGLSWSISAGGVVHRCNGTKLRYAPSTCIVHHWPVFCTMVHKKDHAHRWRTKQVHGARLSSVPFAEDTPIRWDMLMLGRQGYGSYQFH